MSECVDEGEFGGDASEFPALILTYRHMVRIFGIHILDCRDVIVKEILHGAGAYECQLFVFLDAGLSAGACFANGFVPQKRHSGRKKPECPGEKSQGSFYLPAGVPKTFISAAEALLPSRELVPMKRK